MHLPSLTPLPRASAATLAPTDAHAFTAREVGEIMNGIYARGDRLMNWFLASHMLLALVLAFFHQTWLTTILVGGIAWGAFALSAWLLPRTFFTRALSGVAQQAFVALHIFQLHGQAEQHFWFFTAFTMMIVYQDWRCMWPGALLIILQHSLFAGMHNAGLPVHFFPERYVDFTKLFFHFGIAIVHVAICGYWAHLLRLQTLGDAWRRRQLRDDQALLELQLAQLRSSEAARSEGSIALQEASRRQRAILDNSTDLMWVKDIAGRYTAVNTAFSRALGYSMAEIEGRTVRDVADAEAAALVEAQDAEVLATRTAVTVERTSRVGGDERVFEVTITPIIGEFGEATGTTGTARDITDRRRLEDERARDAARMQEAQKLESLGLLAGGVAHDFNNLLGVIQANAELARLDLPADSPVREPFTEIERSAQRAADLTRQMLAYAGMGRVAIELVDISTLVRGTADLLRSVVTKKAQLHFDLEGTLPPVEGDATQLRQVVMNLISNASDAIGEYDGTITLRTMRQRLQRGDVILAFGQDELRDGTYVVVEVADTGTGMSRETQQRIFDPFFTTKFVGRGLGLAAVLGILRAHGGAIAIDSAIGRGSTFRIYLPAAQPSRISGNHVALRGDDDSVPAMPQGTILVVDDEPTLRSLASRVLARSGYVVEVASDGVEALERLAAVPSISIVLLDMLMPRMNGDETLRAIRARYPFLPVLLTSGFSEAVAADRLLDDVRVGFIQKPYGARQLIAALEGLRASIAEAVGAES